MKNPRYALIVASPSGEVWAVDFSEERCTGPLEYPSYKDEDGEIREDLVLGDYAFENSMEDWMFGAEVLYYGE